MKKTFFSHDKNFYAALFPLLIIISLQNLISYSVNMADNIMLGAYSQNALSGAALVNQIFFLIQQAAVVIGDGLVVISSQYWGQKRMEPIRQITGMVLKIALGLGIFLIILCSLFPEAMLGFFTSDVEILSEAGSYLQIIKYTFLLYLVTQVLLSALRSVETVRIAFVISCVSLVVNVSINYILIYGRFGFPELGIRGAAIGTMLSRCLEFLIVLIYVAKIDKKLKLFSDRAVFHINRLLRSDYSGFYIWNVVGDFCTDADRNSRAFKFRCDRRKFCRKYILSIYESCCACYVFRFFCHDGKSSWQGRFR